MFDFLRSRRETPVLPEGTVRKHYRIFGSVQGVGFRYRSKYAAQSLNLTGWVRNLDDGSVEMELQGTPERMDGLFTVIQSNDYIQISDMRIRNMTPDPWERSFVIRDEWY